MKIYFASDVDAVVTSVHRHERRKVKKGEEPVRLVAECNDESCIAEMERYGGSRTIREVRPTYDEREAETEAKKESERLSAVMARELAKQGRDLVEARG